MGRDKEREKRLLEKEMTLKTIFLMRRHLVDWLYNTKHLEFYFEANEILIDAEEKIWEEIVYGDEDPYACEESNDINKMIKLVSSNEGVIPHG